MNNVNYGKLPPQDLNAEKGIISICLTDSSAIEKAISLISYKSFYKEEHQLMWQGIEALHSMKRNVDCITLNEQLKKNGTIDAAGGVVAIVTISAEYHSPLFLQEYCLIVKEKYILRSMINIGQRYAVNSFEQAEDPLIMLESMQKELMELVPTAEVQKGFYPMDRMLAANDWILRAKAGGTAGIRSGYNQIDRMTGGFAPGDLYVVAGLPGTFKTAFVLNLQHNCAAQGVPSLMFQMEMGIQQIGIREISLHSGISISDLRAGKIIDTDMALINRAIGEIESLNSFICLQSGLSIRQLVNIAKTTHKQNKLGLIIIDYLQLMYTKGNSKEEGISEITRELKSLSKELNIPIILLSQFSREAQRDRQTLLNPPSIGHLKYSGAIEADSDTVMLLWNPSKYEPGFMYPKSGTDQVCADGKIGIVFAKNRMGGLGIVWVDVDAPTNKFLAEGTQEMQAPKITYRNPYNDASESPPF